MLGEVFPNAPIFAHTDGASWRPLALPGYSFLAGLSGEESAQTVPFFTVFTQE
jgi:hypothetical protein